MGTVQFELKIISLLSCAQLASGILLIYRGKRMLTDMNKVVSYFALCDGDGFPKEFYCREVHGEDIPSGTV